MQSTATAGFAMPETSHHTYVQPAPCISFFRRYNTVMNKDTANICTDTQTTASCLHLPPDIRTIRCVGDSITEGWVANDAAFFEDIGYVGRGIGGQTSSHFLLRFREDVIKLAPALVVINAGTNDIAENAGAYNEEYTFGNIVSMVELARANKIKVILTSVLPAAAFGWNPSVKDAPQKIMQLNARIRKYAQENKIPYVDYYSEMVEGDNKALNSSYTRDGVHPTLEGYKVMEALIKKAIDKVL